MRKHKVVKDFDYYIDEYMYYCQSRKLRAKTMQSYEQTLRLFERWCNEEEEINDPKEVTEACLRRYICNLQERGKYTVYSREERKKTNRPDRRRDYESEISVTTINNYIRNIKAFFTWFAYEVGACNPMERIRQLKNERTPQEYLDDNEIEGLLKSYDLGYFAEHRDYMIVLLLLDTGMRIGECLEIRMKDLDMKERVILLPAENTKGRKARSVFYSQKTGRALQRWLRFKDRYAESDLLFCVKNSGGKLEISSFESNFRKQLKRAEIEKDVSPHTLRNNFAKRCIMAGMDLYTLSRILGHSSVTVTEKAYMDLTEQDIRSRYQNFSPIENLNR